MKIRYFISIFFISIAILAAELSSIRFMSVVNFSDFAAMIISIALLGFGISGVLITIYKEKLKKYLDIWLFLANVFFVIFSSYLFFLAQKIPFVPQSIQQDTRQIFYLTLYYFLFFLPFLSGAFFINLLFLRMKQNINQIYFFNMVGSGVGAFASIFFMSRIQPQYLMFPVVCMGIISLFFQLKSMRVVIQGAIIFFAICLAILPFLMGLKLKISPYKDISYAIKAPDAKIICSIPSPLGYIQIVRSSQFHFAPGLSLSSYNVDIPNEYGIFIDGVSSSGVARNFTGNKATYINFLPFSIPFKLINQPDVLILGADGGNSILYAEKLNAKHITAVEPNGFLISVIKRYFKEYTDGLWNRKELSVHVIDSRSFCKRSTNQYDIITIPSIISSGISFSSGSGHGENYLFTREALEDYMALLKDNGILYISTKLQSPPRKLLKLESLSFSYIKKKYPDDFFQRIIIVRGLDWGSVMIKKGVFSNHDIAILKKKVSSLSADFSYYPNINYKDTNINNQINDELYYKLAMAYVKNKEQSFLDSYFFNIKIPTDNKPYFNQFLKFSTLTGLFSNKENLVNIPFSEWGYILLWATLLQGIIFSMIIIVLPIITTGKGFVEAKGKWRVIVYFSSLGMGYMFIEIAVIQKFVLFIANPIYSVAVVIATLLITSGIGSSFSRRYKKTPLQGVTIGVLGIVMLLLLHMFLVPVFVNRFLGLSQEIRISISFLLLAPLGFFMGFPFPLGLHVLAQKREILLPWGLAINGSVSVFATVLTSILSMHLGFTVVFLFAAALYLLAYASFPKLLNQV